MKHVSFLIALLMTAVPVHAGEKIRELGLYAGALHPLGDEFNETYDTDVFFGISYVTSRSGDLTREWSFQYYDSPGEYPDMETSGLRTSPIDGTREDRGSHVHIYTLAWTIRHHRCPAAGVCFYGGMGFNASTMCENYWSHWRMNDTGELKRFEDGDSSLSLGVHVAAGTEYDIGARGRFYGEARYLISVSPFESGEREPEVHYAQLIVGWRFVFKK